MNGEGENVGPNGVSTNLTSRETENENCFEREKITQKMRMKAKDRGKLWANAQNVRVPAIE